MILTFHQSIIISHLPVLKRPQAVLFRLRALSFLTVPSSTMIKQQRQISASSSGALWEAFIPNELAVNCSITIIMTLLNCTQISLIVI